MNKKKLVGTVVALILMGLVAWGVVRLAKGIVAGSKQTKDVLEGELMGATEVETPTIKVEVYEGLADVVKDINDTNSGGDILDRSIKNSIRLLKVDESPYKEYIADSNYEVSEGERVYSVKVSYLNSYIIVSCSKRTGIPLGFSKPEDFSDEDIQFFSKMGKYVLVMDEGLYSLKFT